MMAALKRAEIWVFFALIVVVNAACVAAIQAGVLPAGPFSTGRFLILGAILFGVVFLSRGWRGIVELLKPLAVWKVNPGWYLFGILWGGVVAVLALLVHRVATGSGPEITAQGVSVLQRPSVLRAILIASFIGEIVWISYALRQLSGRMSMLWAAHVVGVVWGLWWLPMMVTGIGVLPGVPVGALFLSQTGVALMCAFAYLVTRSGLVIFAMQFAFQCWLIALPVSPRVGGPEVYWIFSALYYALALALLVGLVSRRGGRDLS